MTFVLSVVKWNNDLIKLLHISVFKCSIQITKFRFMQNDGYYIWPQRSNRNRIVKTIFHRSWVTILNTQIILLYIYNIVQHIIYTQSPSTSQIYDVMVDDMGEIVSITIAVNTKELISIHCIWKLNKQKLHIHTDKIIRPCIMLSRPFYSQKSYNISWYPERRWS